MSLSKSRNRLYVRGLGSIEIRQVTPTPDLDFVDAGYLSETNIVDESTMEEIVAETGDLVDWLESQRKTVMSSQLLQTGKDEFDLTRNAGGKVFAIRYSGQANQSKTAFQYFYIPYAKISPGLNVAFKNGLRTQPLAIRALKDFSQLYYPFDYALFQADGDMQFGGMQLFVAPDLGLNAETVYVLDIAGFGYNAILPTARATSIWLAQAAPTLPSYILRFDGTQDYASFGNVLNDDGTGDFAIEMWVRVVGDTTAERYLLNKRLSGVGWSLTRVDTSGNAHFYFDGTGGAAGVSIFGGALTTNVWKHVGVAIDRNGNGTVYVNGSPGTPVNVNGEGSASNTEPLYVARYNTVYSAIDMGALRVYRWAAGGLPSDISARMLAHFNAEKVQYGL